MSVDDLLWEALCDRDAPDGSDGAPEPHGRVDPNRDARARVLDAAVDLLAATRQLVGALEEAVREKRDRLAAAGPDSPDPDEAGARHDDRRRIDLTY